MSATFLGNTEMGSLSLNAAPPSWLLSSRIQERKYHAPYAIIHRFCRRRSWTGKVEFGGHATTVSCRGDAGVVKVPRGEIPAAKRCVLECVAFALL
ncbi:hypothetical protein M513_03081 [Trichuris suis]|uniref:Uncharacterized protein n=1 Tax=Trichuris suis TaxID=68888 RepID=A0A085MFG1_9BILA|nr:hypothetical protein M513_03081 [Trichuris suis]